MITNILEPNSKINSIQIRQHLFRGTFLDLYKKKVQKRKVLECQKNNGSQKLIVF